MSRRAIILAGGLGTRLRPYTVVLPKPLMPIGNYPILEVIVIQLARFGFDHITIAVNHQAEIIKAFFQNGDRWGVRIDYSMENQPLGTMAPLKLIKDLPDNFLVMNGDILTDLNFADFYDQHITDNSIFTISSNRRKNQIDYGVLDIDNNGYLEGFKEKPVINYEVSMGIYMVGNEVMKFIPKNAHYGFDNLMIDLLGAQRKIRVKMFEGYWLDIGRPDDYIKAIEEFDVMKKKFLDG